jgi:hypothetical protein
MLENRHENGASLGHDLEPLLTVPIQKSSSRVEESLVRAIDAMGQPLVVGICAPKRFRGIPK